MIVLLVEVRIYLDICITEARPGHQHCEAFVERGRGVFVFGHKGSGGKLYDPTILGMPNKRATYLSIRHLVVCLMHLGAYNTTSRTQSSKLLFQ